MIDQTDPPPPTTCTDFGFAEVDFLHITQPRLVVRFSDGLQLLLADRGDIDLAADLIATIRLNERRQQRQGGAK